jgi:hypothetical protein
MFTLSIISKPRVFKFPYLILISADLNPDLNADLGMKI